MSALNFDLPALDATLTGDLSMAFDASDVTYGRDASTCAILYVPTQALKDTFKFIVDSSDVDDLDTNDTKYYVVPSSFPKVNVAHAMTGANSKGTDALAAISPAMATVNQPIGGTNAFAEKQSLVKHDFMRHVAQRLFNTYHGLDLVSNEEDVSRDISKQGDLMYSQIDSALSDASAGSLAAPVGNETADRKNMTRELVRHIMASASQKHRLGELVPGQTHSVPFEAGDTISFHVTVQAPTDQEILTNVAADSIEDRVYHIILIAQDLAVGETVADLNNTEPDGVDTQLAGNAGGEAETNTNIPPLPATDPSA